MKITGEAVKKIEEDDRIDALRIKAFKTNAVADRQAYFDAVSKWFQGRHDRSAALPHLQTGFKVKQLEWVEGGKGLAVRKFFSTNRMYSITENYGGGYIVETDNSSRSLGNKDSLKAAKELAQADFERRVRECIDGGVDVADIRQVLKKIIKAWENTKSRKTSVKEIQRWLIEDMKPAIDAGRAALAQGGGE